MSRRLLVVSNRGPVSYARGDGGVRVARRGGGGLVTALAGLVATHEVTWVCSAIGDEDRAVAEDSGGEAIEEQDAAGNPFRLRLVPHDPDDYDRFYNVFANPLLWFVQHDLWGLALEPDIDASTRFAWTSYQIVNQALAEAAAQELERLGPDTSVMLHDYQLYTAPAILRREAPLAIVSHFCHIPWPGPASWRVVPTVIREAIAEGLLACDVVGFHTRRYANEFLRFCQDLGYETSREEAAVRVGSRWVHARAYPISVDPEAFAALAELPEVRQQEERIEEDRPERIVLRVDRTDPSKNIVRGFRAFDLFLQQHPEWHGRVRMLALLDPSRQEIPEYAEYLAHIHRTARQVGARWLDGDGHPAIDLRIQDNFPEVIAGYRQYDVLFVNALIDGMNLIAKEAPLVNARNGVLILSENAGAYAELGEWAVSVNPFDLQGQADAIAAALEMPEQERRRRAEGIRDHVREHDVRAWIDAQLADLDAVGAGR